MSINRISETSEDLDEIIHNVKSHQDLHVCCLINYEISTCYRMLFYRYLKIRIEYSI